MRRALAVKRELANLSDCVSCGQYTLSPTVAPKLTLQASLSRSHNPKERIRGMR